ncbi:GmrSD restriction endonuclease domain-containing protein [Hoeflea sp.]|uniref:GmrSD restriction endonuclease domain-containing protein n=1 Tax=Hoeflea sp. TaxID=1940281 RepID=UPI003B52592D
MSELKTVFKRVDYDLSNLLHYIDLGDIGLPDIQRPFVWSNAKVRDLFDSMYKGFPVGYLLFWENAAVDGVRQIGDGNKAHKVPNRLIVDGQQRLTSLYAVFRGRRVLDANYAERQIEVAFNPRTSRFDVADAAIRRDPEWIANISDLWSSTRSSRKIVNDYIEQASRKAPLTEDEEEIIAHNLDRLFDLQKYPFTALEIASSVDEEQVADIFVRINSEGVKLNQADFILTLLSVFWDEGRKELEDFCRQSRVVPSRTGEASPYNHFVEPDPDQLLRVSVAVGFGRGRLKSVYQILRGKDPDSAKVTVGLRDRQFEVLKQAQKKVLDLRNWHQFLKALVGAGYRAGEMISSQNALLYAYAFYLWGREELGVAEHILQRTIGRWFFFTSLTGRYTSSPESVMEQDLNRLKGTATGEEFVSLLNELIASELTNDYWTITLPSDLATSSARNPQLFAYVASQNRLGARVLFSNKKVAELIDPALRATKKPLERHHLFPRGWLEDNGVEDLREINQIANYALLEWPDNIDIGKKAPFDYFGEIEKRFADQPEVWNKMLADHALPDKWQSMKYPEFLQARRILMADIIRKGFESL